MIKSRSAPESADPRSRTEVPAERDCLLALESPGMDERNVQLFART